MTRDLDLSLWSSLLAQGLSHSACSVEACWSEMTKKSWEGPWWEGIRPGRGTLGSGWDKGESNRKVKEDDCAQGHTKVRGSYDLNP